MGDPLHQPEHLPRLRPQGDQQRWFWSSPQLRSIALLSLLATALLAATTWRRLAVILDPPPPYPARYGQLKDRLDPNTATIAELAVLPGIGPSKAEAIVRFRESRPAPAFTKPTDLTQVRGIGDITAQKLAPYLYLPDPPNSAAGTAGSE